MKVVYRMWNNAEVANGAIHVRVVPTHGEELVIEREPGTAVSITPKFPWKVPESKEGVSEEGAPVAHTQPVEGLYEESDALRVALADMTAERDAALARIRELEAPPVVPRDYRIEPDQHHPAVWRLFYGDIDGGDSVLETWGGALIPAAAMLGIDPAAVRALLWAAEHDQSPSHEADADGEVGRG